MKLLDLVNFFDTFYTMDHPFLIPFRIYLRKYELCLSNSLLLMNQLCLFHAEIKLAVDKGSSCDMFTTFSQKFPLCEKSVVHSTYLCRARLFDIVPDTRQILKYFLNFRDSSLVIDYRESARNLMRKGLELVFVINGIFNTFYFFRRHFAFFDSLLSESSDLLYDMSHEEINSKQLYNLCCELKLFCKEMGFPHDPDIPLNHNYFAFACRPVLARGANIPWQDEIVRVFEVNYRRLIKERLRILDGLQPSGPSNNYPPDGVLAALFPSLAFSW